MTIEEKKQNENNVTPKLDSQKRKKIDDGTFPQACFIFTCLEWNLKYFTRKRLRNLSARRFHYLRIIHSFLEFWCKTVEKLCAEVLFRSWEDCDEQQYCVFQEETAFAFVVCNDLSCKCAGRHDTALRVPRGVWVEYRNKVSTKSFSWCSLPSSAHQGGLSICKRLSQQYQNHFWVSWRFNTGTFH